MKQIFSFFIILFLASCSQKPKDVLVAERIDNDNESKDWNMSYKIRLTSDSLLHDPNFAGKVYQTMPYDSVFSYSVQNDTIYFAQEFSRSKKAIVKNGFIEFIESYPPFKIAIKKNELIKDKNPNFCNSKDFTYFTAYGLMKKYTFDDFGEHGKDANLSCEEEQQVRNLLQKAISENKDRFENNVTEKDYFKSCIVITNQNKEKLVMLSAYLTNGKTEGFLIDEFKSTEVQIKASRKAATLSVRLNLTKNTYSNLAT